MSLARDLLVSPAPAAKGPFDRWDAIALGLSVLFGAWLLWFKLVALRELAYTSDLFEFSQLATSWLDGRALEDQHCGNHLTIHTHFLVLALAPLVRPLGPVGSILALAVAAGATVFVAARVARALGVPGPVAVAAAT